MSIEVVTALANGAIAAMNAGDAARHDRLIAEAAATLDSAVDVICLAQASMGMARAEVQARVSIPVLTSPATAVARLKAILTGSAGA